VPKTFCDDFCFETRAREQLLKKEPLHLFVRFVCTSAKDIFLLLTFSLARQTYIGNPTSAYPFWWGGLFR